MPSSLSKYFPPPTWDKILGHYLPATGAASYVLFSAHCLNPTGLLVTLFPTCWHPISVGIWFNAHLGIGLFYYHRQHLRQVSDSSRIIYSVYSTVLFNFGSILFWSAVADVLPRQNWIRVSFGILTSVCFLSVGREYLSFIDSFAMQKCHGDQCVNVIFETGIRIPRKQLDAVLEFFENVREAKEQQGIVSVRRRSSNVIGRIRILVDNKVFYDAQVDGAVLPGAKILTAIDEAAAAEAKKKKETEADDDSSSESDPISDV